VIEFYGITTCIHCKMAKAFLEKEGQLFREIWIDTFSQEERDATLARLKDIVGERVGFPVLLKEGKLISAGFQEAQIRNTLGLEDEVEKLKAMLAKVQKPLGYLFNPDPVIVHELLNGLLINRKRYGYMACPCRLASGDREKDSDIICPCRYREPDVNEYGRCYCGLYVNEAWKMGRLPSIPVPERRHPGTS